LSMRFIIGRILSILLFKKRFASNYLFRIKRATENLQDCFLPSSSVSEGDHSERRLLLQSRSRLWWKISKQTGKSKIERIKTAALLKEVKSKI
jgi:hypothetical protein